MDIDPTSPNFFILLLLGGAILYGIMPDIGAGFLILAMLWLLGMHPIMAIALAVAWCLRWLVWDFLLAFIFGYGGGLGARASGVFRWRGRPADYE